MSLINNVPRAALFLPKLRLMNACSQKIYKYLTVITSERSEYMGRLVDIQIALKPSKNEPARSDTTWHDRDAL